MHSWPQLPCQQGFAGYFFKQLKDVEHEKFLDQPITIEDLERFKTQLKNEILLGVKHLLEEHNPYPDAGLTTASSKGSAGTGNRNCAQGMASGCLIFMGRIQNIQYVF